jgi:hypothetical protein
MPYRNQRNVNVAEQVNNISQTHINRENQISDFSTSYEIPSQLESAVMRIPEVHGGSGFAAATVKDLGFANDATLGATSAEGGAVKRRVRKKAIEVGEGLSAAGISAGGVSAGGISAGGISAGAQPTKGRKKKEGGALLSLRSLDSMHGQPPDTIRATQTLKAEGITVGSGGGRGSRHAIVKEVMQKHGLSLPQASKFVKEHNLY